MSARRTKRTNTKRGKGVCDLQARSGKDDLQAKHKPVPQRESEELEETDTENGEDTGGQYMPYGFKDRLIDAFREHKVFIIQAAVILIIAIIAMAAMAPSKGAFTQLKEESEAGIAKADSQYSKLKGDVDSILALGALATADDVAAVANQTQDIGSDITALRTRLDLAKARIDELEAQLATVSASPPEGYLTSTFGNYTLHAKASKAGNFTSNINMVYSPSIIVGNTTCNNATAAFYGSVDWTATAVKDYVPSLTYNGTDWAVSKVSFNVGTFTLNATAEKAIPVVFGGLNSTYAPAYAYVEVWPILNE